MTNKTYEQLYWDKEFIEKRIQEQKDYILAVAFTPSSEIPYERWKELLESALPVLRRFERQLNNIKKLK